jgi:hypothetical protein
MRLLQYFAPSDWPVNNSRDLDMSTEPVLLPGGRVLIAGKSRIAYLLNGAHLGGIGGQLASLGPACTQDVDGGEASAGTTVYLPCTAGVVAVRATASPPGLRLLWKTGTGGGPPIVAAGLVWTMSQEGTLYGLDPRTGQIRQQAATGTVANHFPTPGVGAGLLLAPAAERVVAFRASGDPASRSSTAPAGQPSTAPAAKASPSLHASGSTAAGGLSGGALAAIVVAGLVVLGGIGRLLWRRAAVRRVRGVRGRP